jgi:hypothetical protein
VVAVFPPFENRKGWGSLSRGASIEIQKVGQPAVLS